MSNKPQLVIILFRTKASDLSKKDRLEYSCIPYNLEKLPKQNIIGYGLMTGRVSLNILSKYIEQLKQPDAIKLEKTIKNLPSHQAYYISKTHWLSKPIDAKTMRNSSIKFLSLNDPIIIKLRKNSKIQMYHAQHSIKYGILSMCPTWIKEIQSGNKQWLFQEPINRIAMRNSKWVKKILTNPQRQLNQITTVIANHQKPNAKKIRAQKILHYIHSTLRDMKKYISDKKKANDDYSPKKDRIVKYVVNYLKRWDLTEEEMFQAKPLLISWSKYTPYHYKELQKLSFSKLKDGYTPGRAQSAG